MSRQQARRTVRFALLYPVLALLIGALVVPTTGLLAQDQPDKPKQEPKSLTETLGGDDRYLTHITTDKPIYRGGEIVYVRGTVLHAFTNKPIHDRKDEIEAINKQIEAINSKRAINQDDRQKIGELNQRRWEIQRGNRYNPMVEIKDPKGATVVSGRTDVQDSTIGFKWEVPSDQAGGEYTIKVSYPWSGLAPAERTFDIRAYRPPRIKTQIDFLKDGYGPGDTVVATVDATRAEGGIPEGAKVTAIARVDGDEVARVGTMVRETGIAEVRFNLPDKIERGEGSLTFVIEDGGVVESASKTLPILLQTLDLSIYPEGGDLVAGVENRVYIEAKTPFGKPADIQGDVLDHEGKKVGQFLTTHEGRGVFSFTPRVGQKYTLQISEPSSITQTFELPASLEKGMTLDISKTVMAFDDVLEVTAQKHQLKGTQKIEVRQREKIVATRAIGGDIDAATKLPIELPITATGILTVTAYDAQGKPLAERLIYRAPQHSVNIEIMPDSAQYTPGGEVQLTIKTTDQDGKPVSAVAGVTVTDDAVLEMIETREQAPNLPAMVFLEQEVKDLADAHVYLDPNNEDAAEQLDLLLGTQGWRRFALVNLEDFLEAHGDDARSMLALRIPVKHEVEKFARRLNRAADFEGLELAAGAGAGEVAEAFGLAAEADVLKGVDAAFADDAAALAVPNAVPVPEAAVAPEDPQAPEEPQAEPEPQIEVPEENKLADALGRQADREAENAFLADEALEEIVWQPMVFIREYAHKQPAGKPIGQRSDFTETVYWSSATKTDNKGLATITFDLSDSVTSFRVKTDAFTKDGALGANSELIESVRPFYVEPKLPLELTAGDKVLLPIAMVNNTEDDLGVELFLSKLGRAGTVSLDSMPLAADTRGRAVHELTIGQTYGELAFNIEARAGNFFDQNNRKLRVVPKGFPIDDGSGGMLTPDGEINQDITIPETTVPGSLSATVTVYPTPLANLTEALEALIRDPYGCFEQTSSTTFPLVMAQQYFMTHQGVDPDLIARSKAKLDAGYKRLIGFETEKDGYEWFGSTPPHEALTAYGLLQFNEMKDVMDVDQKMIERTQDWLLSRCGEDGSFKLDKKQLDSFGGAPQDTTDAYIVWSMLEAGYDPAKIEKSIDLVLKKATEGNDAYIIALGANIAQLAKREEAKALLDKLAGKLSDEGFVEGASTSITRSGGDALKIETTSLAILAWLRDDSYTGQVEKSILWLTERCKAGRFGSTQSTVLALKAIVEYDKARSTPKAPGSLVVTVDGKPVGEPVEFNEETKGAIHLPAIASHLTPGKHTIAVKMKGGSKMPYSIAVDYFADTPASSDECKLRIETSLNGDGKVAESETTEVNVKVANITKDGLPTPIAIVGLPGGLEPDFDQLKELIAVGKIAAFEVIGRDVVLYWREMKPEQSVELSIRCTAAVPGTYTGPASRTYLYYTDEHKQWVDGLAVTITPRSE
ncbi:MAG: alpha-2-macroglobulin family protein [Phycisphaeraceae bacterium]